MEEQALLIARRVRKACEKTAKQLADDPKNKKFYDWASEWNRDSLSCMCAVASASLTKALREAGIKAYFVAGQYDTSESYEHENHCWVELASGTIIDITATQFEVRRKVLVGNYDKLKKFRKKRLLKTAVPRKLWDLPSQDPTPGLVKKVLANM